LFDHRNNYFFNGNKRKFDVSTQLVHGQLEGVEFFNNTRAFVTNELYTNGTTTVTAKLKVFDVAQYLPPSFYSAVPVAAFTANNVSICENNTVTFTNQSTGAPTSWQWSFPGGVPSSSTQQHPQVHYPAAGTYPVTLVATNSAGSDTLVKTNYITVSPLPTAVINASGPTTFCFGGSVTLNANTGSGLTYQWKNNGVNISGAAASSYVANTAGSYTCQVTNSCGNQVSNPIDVIIETMPNTPAIPSGPVVACKSSTGNVYSVSAVAGATSYFWSTPVGATIVSGQGTNSITIDFSGTAVSGNICVYAANNCGNSSAACLAVLLTGAVPAKPAGISGGTLQCPGTVGAIYSCPAVVNASSYNWTVPAGATIISGQGTNSVTVNFLSNFATGAIKVAAANCKGSSSQRSLTIYGKPSTPGVISGPSTAVCAGSANVGYSIAPVNAATGYNWTAPANAAIVSGQGTTSVTVNFGASFTSGSMQVTASNVCGSGPARNLNVRSVPPRPGVISGPAGVCANQQGVVYSIANVAGATAYNWVVPAGSVITSGQNSTSVTVNFGTAGGTVKVRAGNACGNSTYRNLTVAVTCKEMAQVFSEDQQPEIFPNPSSSLFTLRVNSSDPGEQFMLILRDLTGREVERYEQLSANEEFIFGSQLPSGAYLAEVIIGNDRQFVKLIKQE
jgi:PKD repeat protein